jgi:hypothetical protein
MEGASAPHSHRFRPKKVNAMRLLEVAARLRELALQFDCEELNVLAGEIARRPSGQRVPATSAPMTDALREKIRAIKKPTPICRRPI